MFAKFFTPALVAALAAVLVNACAVDPDFHNDWHEELNFECPSTEVIGSIYSVHSNKHDDRKFRFTCNPPPSSATPGDCAWTDELVNNWVEPVMYACPRNMVLAGVKSYFRTKSEDRRMHFKCCKDSNVRTMSCDLTEYLNDWDEELAYNVPHGQVLIGWFSAFSEKKGDRRHKMLECRYVSE
ncbi:hemagglutinin/amebocyte aggregation factor-like [Elysia marginata]|uniref:Hemagglutinin/amebocyte aggregation factor-like n=1 Tax=Elysia marginata TaxID=1093978 RepID=A0AAV4J9R1_9GAST|nr:hemagglutinin/amebocyte aggregation factor-like [Elysia marginata]